VSRTNKVFQKEYTHTTEINSKHKPLPTARRPATHPRPNWTSHNRLYTFPLNPGLLRYAR